MYSFTSERQPDGQGLFGSVADNPDAVRLRLHRKNRVPAEKALNQGVPPGIAPEVCDITYYVPWGNLAIFYRDVGYAVGLVRLGRFDAGVEALSARGP